jgi:3-hydroxyisobutyrate dehydrogenase
LIATSFAVVLITGILAVTEPRRPVGPSTAIRRHADAVPRERTDRAPADSEGAAMTKAVTVLGTGIMGAGMTRSLVRVGLDVTVWNRSTDKAAALADDGAHVADDIPAAVRGADVVLTMLFDLDAVTGVMAEALPAMTADTVWVQCATVGLDGAAQLAELAREHGVGFLDAPVLGTRQPAEQGQLIVLAAGPRSVRDPATPVLDAIGSRTVWVSERPGDGHRLKLVANSWVLTVTAGVAQSIGLATDLGLDPRLFLDVIGGGPLDCEYAQLKGASMIEGDFAPAFTLEGAAKDSELIMAAMHTVRTEDALMRALRRLFGTATEAGQGHEDMSAVVTVIRGTDRART